MSCRTLIGTVLASSGTLGVGSSTKSSLGLGGPLGKGVEVDPAGDVAGNVVEAAGEDVGGGASSVFGGAAGVESLGPECNGSVEVLLLSVRRTGSFPLPAPLSVEESAGCHSGSVMQSPLTELAPPLSRAGSHNRGELLRICVINELESLAELCRITDAVHD